MRRRLTGFLIAGSFAFLGLMYTAQPVVASGDCGDFYEETVESCLGQLHECQNFCHQRKCLVKSYSCVDNVASCYCKQI